MRIVKLFLLFGLIVFPAGVSALIGYTLHLDPFGWLLGAIGVSITIKLLLHFSKEM